MHKQTRSTNDLSEDIQGELQAAFDTLKNVPENHHIPENFSIGKSTIKDAGNGLFANVDFKKNDFITMYAGTVKLKTEMGQKTHLIVFRPFSTYVIDGFTSDNLIRDDEKIQKHVNLTEEIDNSKTWPSGGIRTPYMGYASLVNSDRNSNVKFERFLYGNTGAIYLTATKEIKKGEELLANYVVQV